MRPISCIAAAFALVTVAGTSALAQGTDSTKAKDSTKVAGVEGHWRGSVDTPNGTQEINCVIKKDKDVYSGTITGMQGDVAFNTIKVTGDTLTASTTITTPNGSVDVWYTFVVKGDTLSGTAEAGFNGQSMSFLMSFKRVTDK